MEEEQDNESSKLHSEVLSLPKIDIDSLKSAKSLLSQIEKELTESEQAPTEDNLKNNE